MKPPSRFFRLLPWILLGPALVGAGSLTPPGPPGPTMKTLDKVEARIPIESLPYTITASGSYYLVDNLRSASKGADGITVSAENVSIDLNGFALIGAGREAGLSGTGILVPSSIENLSVFNGTVRDWPDSGVEAYVANNSRFEYLRVFANGGYGIRAGVNSQVRHNTVMVNGGTGIAGSVNVTITDNTCRQNGGAGIFGRTSCVIARNTCANSGTNGIEANGRCRVSDNTVFQSAEAGILALSEDNVIRGNVVIGNGVGLELNGTSNRVADNDCRENTEALVAAEGNELNILISELPYTIAHPGHYRLTGSLRSDDPNEDGIYIDARDVVIDLGGHTLTGPGKEIEGSASALHSDNRLQSDVGNITVNNGTIRDWPDYGIFLFAGEINVEEVRALDNRLVGIFADNDATVRKCVAKGGDTGIIVHARSTVEGCVAADNADDGIETRGNSIVRNNRCGNNGENGIDAGRENLVSDNICNGNAAHGLSASINSRVVNNVCSDNGRAGLFAASNSYVESNTSVANGTDGTDFAGISIFGEGSTVLHNLVSENDIGIQVELHTGNYIAGNRATGSSQSPHYDILPGNTLGTGDLANVSY